MKRFSILLGIAGFIVLALYAATPAENVGAKHPNLTQAQSLISRAYEKIVAAQKANEFDLGGHAAKAKDFLDQASKELKLAAAEANENDGKKSGDVKEGKRSDEPAQNIGGKHPNLAKAQQLISEAYSRVSDAQKANEFDLGGHAAKAKNFLDQASQELKLAAEQANQ